MSKAYDTAVETIQRCKKIREMAGVNADYPYTATQLAEAGLAIFEHLGAANLKLAEDLKLAGQQKRAAEARAQKQ